MTQILCLNAGSSSLKFTLFVRKKRILTGEFEEIGKESAIYWYQFQNKKYQKKLPKITLTKACQVIQQLLFEQGAVPSSISHRLLFGGTLFLKPSQVTKQVLDFLEKHKNLAPLHIPNELKLLKISKRLFPKASHVAAFDTSFHSSLKSFAKVFPLKCPNTYQRYGYHGLSYSFLASQKELKDKYFIAAHLGSGSSVCAIAKGKSVDTSMGLTPLGGIMMGTRPGDLDPGLILHLMREQKLSLKKLEQILLNESGLKGVSEISSDMLTLLKKRKSHKKADLAISMYCYFAAKSIAAHFAALPKVEAIVFTGAIGERSPEIRARILKHLESLGLAFDKSKNKKNQQKISTEGSTPIYCYKADEELVLLQSAL